MHETLVSSNAPLFRMVTPRHLTSFLRNFLIEDFMKTSTLFFVYLKVIVNSRFHQLLVGKIPTIAKSSATDVFLGTPIAFDLTPLVNSSVSTRACISVRLLAQIDLSVPSDKCQTQVDSTGYSWRHDVYPFSFQSFRINFFGRLEKYKISVERNLRAFLYKNCWDRVLDLGGGAGQ